MNKLNFARRACAVLVLCATAAIVVPAQTFTTIFNFDGRDGFNTGAALVQGTDGNFYGVAGEGGTNYCSPGGCGTVFKITPSGTLTTLHTFCPQGVCTDGDQPYGALLQALDGSFYGITLDGGANPGCLSGSGCGTVFKIIPGGRLTTLYSFCSQSNCADGSNPWFAGLIQTTDGNLYGTTYGGGASGYGTVFKITPTGTLTTLHSFDGTDGANLYGGLIQATDGNFYGTTEAGGANGYGTVFKMTPSGALTTLHSFDGTDGDYPWASLVQGTDGNFYGTTAGGGAYYGGTVFKITPAGALTTLHSFDGTDGENPDAALIQATDGNFYGTTSYSGAYGSGNVFEITPSGTLTILHNFDGQDGKFPYGAALLQATNGNFYGSTCFGGADNDGTVFMLSMGLAPFVETEPDHGKVGRAIEILGTNLTGATSVTFNGTPAVFTVFSSSLIGTKVPEGATTGMVQVTTPSGVLSSNVPFTVMP